MKNITLLIFTAILSIPVFSQDELNWVLWECESTSPVIYVPAGPRTTLLRYEASWPNNETREVRKCRNGTCHSLGQVSGGEHLLQDIYDNPLTNGYWDSYMFTLQIAGNLNSSTEEVLITTEPEPSLEVGVSVLSTTEGDSIIVTASSETEIGSGWGLIFPFCTSHPIIMIVETSTADNESVFQDTAICVPGEPTTFITGFMYKGPYTELCTEVRIERLDISEVPTFTSREIVTADILCNMAGGSVATAEEALHKESDFLVFPNPCREVLYLQSSTPVVWRVTNMLSSAVITGQGKMIDTSLWSSGVYFLQVEGTQTLTRIVRD